MQIESNHMAWPQAFEQNQQVFYNLSTMKTSVFSLGVTRMAGQRHSFICGYSGKEEKTCSQQHGIQQKTPPRTGILVPVVMMLLPLIRLMSNPAAPSPRRQQRGSVRDWWSLKGHMTETLRSGLMSSNVKAASWEMAVEGQWQSGWILLWLTYSSSCLQGEMSSDWDSYS